MDFERRLIKFMSQNEFMHDSNHPDYDKHAKRKQCWEAIAKELNKDVAYCRTKWFSLRGNYRKLLYKIKANGGMANYQQKKKWKYFDDFAFINKFECMPPLVGYNAKAWNDNLEDNESSLPSDLEFRLIDLVRDNKVLYNPDSPGYNDVDERNYAWSKIAEELNVEKNALKLKWHSLRSAYFKILRKVNEAGGLEHYSPRWRYFDEMSFITPFLGFKPIKNRSNSASLETEQNSPINKVYHEADNDIMEIFDDTDTSSRNENFTSVISSSFEDVDNFEDYVEVNEDMEQLLEDEKDEEEKKEEDKEEEEAWDYEEEFGTEKQNNDCSTGYNNSYEYRECINKKRPLKRARSEEMGPCSKYFFLLGTKIDETGIPNHARFRLEKRVTDLVYDVLAKYSLERVEV